MNENNPVLQAPEDIPAAFVAAWNRRDADGIADLFDRDAEFVNVIGLWWHNRASIRKAHAYGLKTIFSRSKLRLEDTRVKYLADSIAVVHARMQLTGQSAVSGTQTPGERRNIFTFVVHRDNGDWRCAAAHNTDIVPGAETNVVDEDGQLKTASYRQADGAADRSAV